MNISELSSIFLIHSSSPLFSASDFHGAQQTINLNVKPGERLEYFEHDIAFPAKSIFKSTSSCESSCSSFPELSAPTTDASALYTSKSKMPCTFASPSASLSAATPSLFSAALQVYSHSNRPPLKEINCNSHQGGLPVEPLISFCKASDQMGTGQHCFPVSHNGQSILSDCGKNIQPFQDFENNRRRPLSPPLSNTSGPSSSEKSILFPSCLNQEQILESTSSIYKKTPRFSGDLYKPSFVRGSGSEREGRCELCSPPVWLNLKRSTYWYHMNFTHGISSKTGRPYPDPLYVKASPLHCGAEPEKKQVLEAFCRNCRGWISITIPLVKICQFSDVPVFSYDRSNFSDWFKHLQKCLSHAIK
ncbi:hypothetical protein MDAP_001156 [Mitosporidium daphniae]